MHDYKVILKFHKSKLDEIEVYFVIHKQCSYLYKLIDANMKIKDEMYILRMK